MHFPYSLPFFLPSPSPLPPAVIRAHLSVMMSTPPGLASEFQSGDAITLPDLQVNANQSMPGTYIYLDFRRVIFCNCFWCWREHRWSCWKPAANLLAGRIYCDFLWMWTVCSAPCLQLACSSFTVASGKTWCIHIHRRNVKLTLKRVLWLYPYC